MDSTRLTQMHDQYLDAKSGVHEAGDDTEVTVHDFPAVPKPTTVLPPLSQSRFEMMACPHRYVDREVSGNEGLETIWARNGTVIHAAMAKYLNYLLENRLPKAEITMMGYDQELQQIIEGAIARIQVNPERVLGAEMYLALDEELQPTECANGDNHGTWYDDDGNPRAGNMPYSNQPAYEGTLDFVEAPDRRSIDIHDWKSYWQIIEPTTFQAQFYPLLVFQHFPDVEVVRFHLEFVRYGAVRSVEYTRSGDLERLKKLARNARARQRALHHAALNGDSPAAMSGAHCVYCPLLCAGCPLGEKQPYAQMTPEERVQYGMWLKLATQENTRLLKDFVNARGPVTAQDANGREYVAGFHVQARTKYPFGTTGPIVIGWGLQDRVYIGATELNSLAKAKQRSNMRAELEAVAVKQMGTRFGITGTGDDNEEE